MTTEFKQLAKFICTDQRFDFLKVIDWKDFNEYSGSFKTIFFSLIQNGNEIPESIYRTLLEASKIAENKNKLLIQLAADVNGILKQENINVLFYKGISHLFSLYKENLSIRTIRDLDIIVPVDDCLRAKTALVNNGFKEDYSEKGLGDNLEARKWFEQNHFHSIFKKNSLELELHRKPSFNFENTKKLFESSVNFNNYQIPSPEFQIVIQILDFIHDQTINQSRTWYLEVKAKKIIYAFLSLCFEVRKIKNYYKIDNLNLERAIGVSGESEKVKFILNIINELMLGKDVDPLRALVSKNTLFVNTIIPNTNQSYSPLESINRYLFLHSSIAPRITPVGKLIFWINCINGIMKKNIFQI